MIHDTNSIRISLKSTAKIPKSLSHASYENNKKNPKVKNSLKKCNNLYCESSKKFIFGQKVCVPPPSLSLPPKM